MSDTRRIVTEGLYHQDGKYTARITYNKRTYERSLHKTFPEIEIRTDRDAKSALRDFWGLAKTGALDKPIAAPISANVTFATFADFYFTEYLCKTQPGRTHPAIVLQPDSLTILTPYGAPTQRTAGAHSEWKQLRDRFGKFGLVELSRSAPEIVKYRNEMTDKGIKGDRKLQRLCAMFNYAREMEWGVEHNPFDKKKVLRLAKSVPRVGRVSFDEEAKLATTIPTMTGPRKRRAADGYHDFDRHLLWARVLTVLRCGLRREELFFQLKDVNFKEWEIWIAPGKTGKGRVIPIQNATLRSFLQTRRFLGDESYPLGDMQGRVIEDFRAEWEALTRQAGTPDLILKDLRRECCTRWLEGTHPDCPGKALSVAHVAQLLGNSIATVEKHYKSVFHMRVIKAAMGDG